jgi:hypothetical protein
MDESRKERRLTVQPLYRESRETGQVNTYGQVRLAGAWLSAVFPPGTRVRVRQEIRDGHLALVIEALDGRALNEKDAAARRRGAAV